MNEGGLVAIKAGCSTYFNEENGLAIPVTILKVAHCIISLIRNNEVDGYSAVQVAYDVSDNVTEQKIKKPVSGFLKKFNLPNRRHFAEFRLSNNISEYVVGNALNADLFTLGDKVDITGTTKGRGFSGAMKRHNFRGLEATHGVSISHRSPGSTGQRTDPGKTFKNKKMAGQYGNTRKTIKNLSVIDIDVENNLIAVKGAVPGATGGFVFVRTIKRF